METIHKPVLLEEVISHLAPASGKIYVDCNLGLGGHSGRILEESGPAGRVIGFEWDEEALLLARERLSPYGNRLSTVHANFAEIRNSLASLGVDKVDGILVDLGLSSLQLDSSGRGFSFRGSEPLDMRMDGRGHLTARELIYAASAEELADIFYYYGEERQARRIAARIVEERQKQRIETTDQLVSIVEKAVPRKFHPKHIHVATKVFQALRIAVNRELENLEKILADGATVLNPGARFCVISFHSLEDRLVKQAFRDNPDFAVLTKKPVLPGADECGQNPRARSAKLRVAEKKEQRV
jgi:16S rRNA (cytosine1402-N4)-methyltransferase